MKKDIKNSLANTNIYLRDKDKRQAALVASVCSSSAIEGIDAYRIIEEYLEKNERRILPDKHILTD